MICYCASEDGTLIERLYIFPKAEIERVKSISIIKSPIGRWNNLIIPWYEKYRIADDGELKKVNDIWKKILEENK